MRFFLYLALALCACAGGPRAQIVTSARAGRAAEALAAYEDFAVREGDDVSLLIEVAQAMLRASACAADPDEAALAVRELSQAGTVGRAELGEIAQGDCAGSFDATVYLARRGDEASRLYLRGLADSPEPRVRTAVVIALSVEDDRELLLRWARDPDDAVRAQSVERLGALGPSDAEAFALLSELVRVDGNAPVRARAARALGSYEAAAFEPLRERLSDTDGQVRLSAIEALVRADRALARGTLLDLLATGVSVDTIEAARVLTTLVGGPNEAPSDDDRVAALAHLGNAIASGEASLRAQAAVALTGMSGRDDLAAVLAQALARESDATATLSLARALLRREERSDDALRALRSLLGAPGMTSVQAAVELAEQGDALGLDTLRVLAFARSENASVRSVALHALGRDHAGELAVVLRDEDVAARLAAAGAICAAVR